MSFLRLNRRTGKIVSLLLVAAWMPYYAVPCTRCQPGFASLIQCQTVAAARSVSSASPHRHRCHEDRTIVAVMGADGPATAVVRAWHGCCTCSGPNVAAQMANDAAAAPVLTAASLQARPFVSSCGGGVRPHQTRANSPPIYLSLESLQI